MSCELNDGQKINIMVVMKRIADKNATITPEQIIRNVYDTTYESFVKKDMISLAEGNSLAAAQYAAQKLYLVLKEEQASAMREALQAMVGNKEMYSQSAIGELAKMEVLKKIFNIQDTGPKFTPLTVGKDDVFNFLEIIKKAFPQNYINVTFEGKGIERSFSTIKDSEGNLVRLPEVTQFLNNTKYIEEGRMNSTLRVGNLVDMLVRNFLRAPMEFEKFNEQMMNDRNFLQLFADFTESKEGSKLDRLDPLFNQYAKNFLNDMSYALASIQNSYKDYYLTDLTSLLEKTNMSSKEKERFFLYSAEIGLKGELDILAISPDGSFKVVDIKTTQSDPSGRTVEKYNKQTSIYDLIIQKATGLKSKGVSDIVYLSVAISNAANILGRTGEGRYKVSVFEYNRESRPNKSEKELIGEIGKYTQELLTVFPNEVKVTPVVRTKIKAFDFTTMTRGRLKMLMRSQETLSTTESLDAGKAWLLERFPELGEKGIEVLRVLNSDAGGEFFPDLIRLYERSNEGVAYHEGWHRFSQLFLTKKEQINLYAAARKKAENFITRDDRKLNTATAPLVDLEEYLAEKFKDYALKQDKRSTLAKFFDKILRLLKGMAEFFMRNGTFTMQNMFSDLYTNSFNRTNFNVNNSIFTHLNSLYKNHVTGQGELLTNEMFLTFKRASDFKLTQYLQREDITISELMTSAGLEEINRVIFSELQKERLRIGESMDIMYAEQDSSADKNYKAQIDAELKDLFQYVEGLDVVLDPTNDYTNFKGFMRAYYRRSDLTTLNKFTSKNADRANKIVDQQQYSEMEYEDNIADDYEEDEGDEDAEDIDSRRGVTGNTANDLEYNRSGNEKEASEQLRDEVRDMFSSIPRRVTSEVISQPSAKDYAYDNAGIPITLSKEEAFYKTLIILQGSITEENIIKAIRDPTNHAIFPELVFIQERLLGSKNPDGSIKNEGLIKKLQRITEELNSGDKTNMDEGNRLVAYTSHFTHVMSMRYVQFQQFDVNLNNKNVDQELKIVNPLQSRDSLESIINNILGDFTKGFKNNSEKSFKKTDGKYKDIFDLMYETFVSGKNEGSISFEVLSTERYLYDPILKTFYFNPLYAFNLAKDNADVDQMKVFFEYIGINLNENIYSDEKHKKELKDSYDSLRSILSANYRNVQYAAANLVDNKRMKEKLEKWKDLSTRLSSVEESERVILEAELVKLQMSLRGSISSIFSHNPVSDMLFASRDKKLINGPGNKIFAINRYVLESIAKIEKFYHGRFSSGSMLVLDDLQFSYFLQNQMTTVESFINDHIHNVSDMDQYPALNHLNPRINPQIWNSILFQNIYDPNTGQKRIGNRLGLTNIANISIRTNDNESIESKKISALRVDERLLIHMLMVRSEGSGPMRMLETSNTAYRLSLIVNGRHTKIVNVASKGFRDPNFQRIIRGYIQHGAFKYQFNQNSANRDAGSATTWQVGQLDGLGIFDEMIPTSAPKIKDLIKNGTVKDMNSLMKYIEDNDEVLFRTINEEIKRYFEDLTIDNEDSFKVDVKRILSEKSLDILEQLESINSEQPSVSMRDGAVRDDILRDIIANDFIMAMEDSLLFFGDYSFYKDPAKRRKIIANNGSTNGSGPIMAAAKKALVDANSLESIYQNSKGIKSTKNPQLVRKGVLEDHYIDSDAVKGGEGNIKMINDVIELRKQRYDLTFSYQEVFDQKKPTIDAFTKMETTNAAAYVSLATYRTMMQREMRWGPEQDMEYNRQMAIMKRNLGEELTSDEVALIDTTTGGFFNIGKFALTGPIHSETAMPHSPSFDKMGLRVLMPEFDWDRTTRPMFEYMLANDIDYMVYESGSKGYTPLKNNMLSEDARESIFNGTSAFYVEHAGDFLKNQLNTSGAHSNSALSSQLRGIFYEMMLIQKQYGKTSPFLESRYKNFISKLTDYILVNSSRALSDMGLDSAGNIKDKKTFINYIRERLDHLDTVPVSLTDLLSQNLDGSFSTYLEALPFQKDIANLISGIIDDNFRKVRLNGSKLIQTPEAGSTRVIKVSKEREKRGTIELKWHELIKDENGIFTSLTPVESKINFSNQWESLFVLDHPDGNSIGRGSRINSIKRLNEAIQNEEWLAKHGESITFIGVRIPLQDINFSSHVIVREFLPEALGETIIMPPEFYAQTGGDNDIDTVTVTYKELDERGKPISVPKDSYPDIINRINDLSLQISEQKHEVKVADATDFQSAINEIKQKFIDNNTYVNKGKGLVALNDDLTIVESDGAKLLKGMLSNKSTLSKLLVSGEESDLITELMDQVDLMNRGNRNITDPLKKELIELNRKRSNYIKGLTNEIVESIIDFMRVPENYDFLTETDSIDKIQQLAAETLTNKTGKEVKFEDLGKSEQMLDAISLKTDLVNYENNSERNILGSMVKFRTILTMLANMDMKLNTTYLGGSVEELIKRNLSQGDMINVTEALVGADTAQKLYERIIYTPLLYKKDTSNGIDISIFDEDGNRITKNLSMIVSSLLDLFKKKDVFPSLGIGWLNVKPTIFLLATGVPLERVVLFANNPIVQSIDETLKVLGSDAQARHALVTVSQKIFPDQIHKVQQPRIEGVRAPKGNFYAPKTIVNNKEVINKMMTRHGKESQSVMSRELDRNNFTLSEEDLTNFTREYNKWINDLSKKRYQRNLKEFLDKNPDYKSLAKNIMLYYSTLLEDSDIFYKLYVTGLNRDSVKHNSMSAMATAENVKRARITSKMAADVTTKKADKITNVTFEEKLETETTKSPFYKDGIVKNILGNTMPEILNHKNLYFRNKFISLIETITNDIYGTVAYKNKVESKVLADWIELLYKNFYVISRPLIDEKGNPVLDEKGNTVLGKNTLFEWYEQDITPLLGAAKGNDKYKDFIAKFNKNKEASMSSDTKINATFSDSLFSSQFDLLLLKYPELNNLNLLKYLITVRVPGIDPGKDDNFAAKDVMNLLEQNHTYLNLSTNPKEKEVIEEVIRDEFKKLLAFNLTSFSDVENEVSKDSARLAVYRNPDNIKEIQLYFNNLAYYALAQNSHLTQGRGSFSHLVPAAILKDVIETSINNFNNFIDGEWGGFKLGESSKGVIDNMLGQFERMFRDMNGDLTWSNVNKFTARPSRRFVDPNDDVEVRVNKPVETYKPYMKPYTGKLYSKIDNTILNAYKRNLIGPNEAINDFLIDIHRNEENDPLNCKIG